ncbi:DNA gyrase inhibitor YacG [Pseudomonas sp. NW5]|uniref:DNA gyrase inhibitor YacG n=1 Tax=Pseudomonas sp. NW5 TaxID=2934934 RepID=UPI0020209910|nr:DNA gyrase inhibitor YacG [Pseudomonas sp. NW5]MCL7461236.1 DNA gyrase inhibitor YacG [Pseudomonas sp. NW5]
MPSPATIPCPTCQRPVTWHPENRWRPFCSERCKLIDLGAWAAGEHAIPGDNLEDAAFSNELETRQH